MSDERNPMGPSVTPQMSECFRLLKLLTEEQRPLLLCWFCPDCWRYVGPGDTCHCENDE